MIFQPNSRFVTLLDAKMVERLIKGAEGIADGRVIFDNNVQSTFNLMMSAAEMGLRRVVFSSSAFGMGWAHDGAAFEPIYLPLDEEHPMMPFEPYGLSKQVGEDIGKMIARNSTISVVSLRFTNVVPPEGQEEFPWAAPTPEDPLTLVMWAYADPRDVAEAHVLALEADIEGHEAFMIAQPSSRFQEPTLDVIKNNFGDRVEIRGLLEGNSSVISTKKAQRILGWKPRYDWTASAGAKVRRIMDVSSYETVQVDMGIPVEEGYPDG